jgi:hypothetical protein
MKFVYVDESGAADHTDDPAHWGAYEMHARSRRGLDRPRNCAVLQNLCRGFQARVKTRMRAEGAESLARLSVKTALSMLLMHPETPF